MPRYYIGTSGWHYDHWQGRYYPSDLPKTRWLEFYARRFTTVELNNSFYRLPSERAFVAWRESSPPGFVYAVKVSRFITHLKRLRNIEIPLKNFLDRANLLESKLGPLLYQLPPQVSRNDTLLESFLSLLPGGMRHALEFRHPSWQEEEVFQILRRHHTGFCIFDRPGFTTPLIATTDFAYIRFHGSAGLYSSCYSKEELEEWSEKIAVLARTLQVTYIYFNNDAEGYAVKNALELEEKLSSGG